MDNATTLDFTVETITPAAAAELLNKNTNNRKPSTKHIAIIAEAMKNGHFHVTGDAIRIGKDGTLYDGQHRLMACVKADVPFTTAVVRNLDLSAMMVIDGGKRRTQQQQLKIARGYSEFTTDTALMILRMSMGTSSYNLVDADTIAAIIDKHAIIADTAEIYSTAAKLRLGANLPAAELIMRAHGYQKLADAWRKVWVDGDKDELAAAAHTLRELLIRVPDMTRQQAQVWTHVNRRKAMQKCMLLCLMEAPWPKIFHSGPKQVLFPTLKPARLLSVVSFANSDPDTIGTITNLTGNELSTIKTHTKRRAKKAS